MKGEGVVVVRVVVVVVVLDNEWLSNGCVLVF